MNSQLLKRIVSLSNEMQRETDLDRLANKELMHANMVHAYRQRIRKEKFLDEMGIK